jgi:hypothetical protein
MRKTPDISSRKPNDQPALCDVSKPGDRSKALRIAENAETLPPGVGSFAGANAWNG